MLTTIGLSATSGGSGTVQETVAFTAPSNVTPLAANGITTFAYVTFSSNPTLTFPLTPAFTFAPYPTPTGAAPQFALNGCLAVYQNATWQHVAGGTITYFGAGFKAVSSATTFGPAPTTYVYFTNSGGYASPTDPQAFC